MKHANKLAYKNVCTEQSKTNTIQISTASKSDLWSHITLILSETFLLSPFSFLVTLLILLIYKQETFSSFFSHGQTRNFFIILFSWINKKLFHHFQREDKSVVVAAAGADSGRGGDSFGWRRSSGGSGRNDDGSGWRRSDDSGRGSDGFGWRKNHFGSA